VVPSSPWTNMVEWLELNGAFNTTKVISKI